MTSGRAVSKRASWALTLACTISAFGCGGHVNVGGNAPGAEGGSTGEVPADPLAPATLRDLPRNFFSYNLVVAGDYLYLSGFDGTNYDIYRCQKDHCASTFKSVQTPRDPILWLQPFEQRLGVVTVPDGIAGNSWMGSYSLPECGDPQTVIDGLPDHFSGAPPLFWGDSAYFFIDLDHSLYRCQLPNCVDGPHRLSADSGGVDQPEATGTAVFWISNYRNLYRSLDSGRAAAEHLLPGPELQVIPAFDPNANDPERIIVSSIAAADGKLYAALAFGEEQDCRFNHNACVTTVVRWSLQGSGEREVILTLATPVAKLFVVGSELVWTTPVQQSGGLLGQGLEMASCRVEACAETKRSLGHVSDQASRVVADSDHLYWLGGVEVPAEPQLGASASWYNGLIRRAALLPPP